MSAAFAPDIPYEKQLDPQTSRTCGAACLSMVYRSFGNKVEQCEIWPNISKPNRFGSIACTTHLMVADAVSRGYLAAAIQVRHPLQTLRLCNEKQIRVILNHRLDANSAAGHYSVLANMDQRGVVLQDPLFGPARRLSYAELLELWRPTANSEIAGNFLIGIVAKSSAPATCQLCQTEIPGAVECPRCKRAVGLQPAELFGCAALMCNARLWNFLCCPSCDYTWNFGICRIPKPARQAGASKTTPDIPDHIANAFVQLDKFVAAIRDIPEAMQNTEIVTKLEALKVSKQRLLIARAEVAANMKTRDDQVAAMTKAAEENREEHRRKMEQLSRGIPPIDGDVLARALLKNAGFLAL